MKWFLYFIVPLVLCSCERKTPTRSPIEECLGIELNDLLNQAEKLLDSLVLKNYASKNKSLEESYKEYLSSWNSPNSEKSIMDFFQMKKLIKLF